MDSEILDTGILGTGILDTGILELDTGILDTGTGNWDTGFKDSEHRIQSAEVIHGTRILKKNYKDKLPGFTKTGYRM